MVDWATAQLFETVNTVTINSDQISVLFRKYIAGTQTTKYVEVRIEQSLLLYCRPTYYPAYSFLISPFTRHGGALGERR
jgi:hypothetical protein